MMEQQPGLDVILDACLDDIETRGVSVDECLSQQAAYRDQLEPLLRAATQLRVGRSVRPTAAFQRQAAARLRSRLAQAARPANPRPATGALRRRLGTAFAAVLVVAGLAAITTGTIYAAGDSVPGDTLYPVEMAVENAQLDFSPPGQALELRLKFAEKRLREAEKLARKGDTEHLQEAIANYDLLVAEATQLLDSPDAQLDGLPASFAAHQARLEALLVQVPVAARGGIATAIEASKHGQEKAAEAIKKHGGGKPDNTPGGGKPDNTPGGGKPADTPGGGKPNNHPGQKNGNSKGNKGSGDAACDDGSTLPSESVDQARQLAETYAAPYDAVRELFCRGLTAQQVEAQLKAATPANP